MAESSIVVPIFPNCGLQIELVQSNHGGHRQRRAVRQCRIVGPPELFESIPQEALDHKDKCLVSWMSPISRITLPPITREEAGIPDNATSQAFLYPNAELAKKLRSSQKDTNNGNSPSKEHHKVAGTKSHSLDEGKNSANLSKWGWRDALAVGSFVYFDDDNKVLSINAISLLPTGKDLVFSGPLVPTESTVEALAKLNRNQPITLGSLHEAGFVSFAWIQPRETFHEGEESICTVGSMNEYGGLLYCTDHAEHSLYLIDPQQNLIANMRTNFSKRRYSTKPSLRCPETIMRSMSSRMELIREVDSNTNPLTEERFITEHFMDNTHGSGDTITADLEELLFSFDDKDDIVEGRLELARKIVETHRENPLILHKACKMRAPAAMIQLLLDAGVDPSTVLYDDHTSLGWMPLHYACRYEPSLEVIQLLLRVEADVLGKGTARSKGQADKTRQQSAALVMDKYDRYPLHLVCDAGASEPVVRELLRVDPTNQTLFQPSKFLGWLPIHYECATRAGHNVIRTLLNHDPESKTIVAKTDEGLLPLHIALRNGADTSVIHKLLRRDPTGQTVFERFDSFQGRMKISLLPIHMACLKLAPLGTVDQLLAKDDKGTTVYEKVFRVGEETKITNRHLISDTVSSLINGMLPIHVACNVSSPSGDVVASLLRADMTRGTVMKKDSLGRLPLHIALMRKASGTIIHDLLFHHKHHQIREEDVVGRYPFHEACNTGTSAEVMKLLLDTDESMTSDDKKSSLRKRDNRGREAIFYAIRQNASDNVLCVLMRGKHFKFQGLDSTSLERLAERVSTCRELQEIVNNRSVTRTVVAWLLLEIYINMMLLVTYMKSTEDTVRNNPKTAEPVILIFCASYLFFRELIQARRLAYYLSDAWNVIELTRAALILVTGIDLQRGLEDGYEVSRTLLVTTGTFVVIGSLLFLRSTFLPFARFVGGLIEILLALITFLVVSALLLLVFAYAFYVQERADEDGDVIPSLGRAYMYTLASFFGGPSQTRTTTDVLFGIIVVIILLNVLIAIVSSAWDDSGEKNISVFFYFRIFFLCQEETIVDPIRRCFQGRPKKHAKTSFLTRLFRWIDSVPDIRLRDQVRWSKTPFNLVMRYEHYRFPERFFIAEDAEKIRRIRSWEADMLWTSLEFDDGEKRTIFKSNTMITIRWMLMGILYAVLVVVGIPALGVTWPKNFRKYVLGNNYSQEAETDEEEDGMEERIGKLEEKVELLLANGTSTQKQISGMESKLNEIYTKMPSTVSASRPS